MDIKQRLEALMDLTAHPGWEILMQDTRERMETYQSGMPLNIRNEEELWFAKGMYSTLLELLNTRDRVSAALDETLGEGD